MKVYNTMTCSLYEKCINVYQCTYNIQVKYYSNIYIVHVYDQVYPCIYRTELNIHYHHTHTHTLNNHACTHLTYYFTMSYSREPTVLSGNAFLWLLSALKLFFVYCSLLSECHYCKYTDTRSTPVLRKIQLLIAMSIPTVALADCGEGARESHPYPLQCIHIVKVLLHAL